MNRKSYVNGNARAEWSPVNNAWLVTHHKYPRHIISDRASAIEQVDRIVAFENEVRGTK